MPETAFQREVDALLPELLRALEEKHGTNLVSFLVFGSVARREADVGSDVDLLLVFRAIHPGHGERFRIFQEARETLRPRLDALYATGIVFDWSVVILTVDEARYHSPIYLDMVLDARLLLDRDGFFAGVLDGLRARMRELGSRRVTLPDGSWYWDLKPDYVFGEVFDL